MPIWTSPGIIGLAKPPRRRLPSIPGYGFLSENADFARACEENGILFIGPSSDVLAQMGDKLSAKEIAIQLRRAHHPRLHRAPEGRRRRAGEGRELRLPRHPEGSRRRRRPRHAPLRQPEEVKTAYELVHSEAEKAFGNGDIFMEKYLVEPKHIEVQILADQYGNVDPSGRARLLPPAPLSEGGGVRPRLVRAPGDRWRPCAATP